MTGRRTEAGGSALRRIDASHVLATAALLLPAIGVLTPPGVAPLLAVTGLALLVLGGRPLWSEIANMRVTGLLMAAIGLWAALSSLWSITPGRSLVEALRLLLTSFAALVVVAGAAQVNEPRRHRVATGAMAGIVIGMVLIGIEALGDFPLRRFIRGEDGPIAIVALDRSAQILVLAGIAAAAVWGNRWTAMLVAAVIAIILSVLMSSTAVVSLGAGIIAYLLALRWKRAVAFGAVAVFVVLTVAMPTMQPSREMIGAFYQTVPSLRTSAHHRLVIWNWTADRIVERPVLGWGFDTSRALPGGQQEVEAYMPLRDFGLDMLGQVMPLHPHNAILQWWVELGVFGAVLGAALVCWLWLQAMAAGPSVLAYAAAAMPPLLLSFGVWQWWWLATLALVAAVIRTAPRRVLPDSAGSYRR